MLISTIVPSCRALNWSKILISCRFFSCFFLDVYKPCTENRWKRMKNPFCISLSFRPLLLISFLNWRYAIWAPLSIFSDKYRHNLAKKTKTCSLRNLHFFFCFSNKLDGRSHFHRLLLLFLIQCFYFIFCLVFFNYNFEHLFSYDKTQQHPTSPFDPCVTLMRVLLLFFLCLCKASANQKKKKTNENDINNRCARIQCLSVLLINIVMSDWLTDSLADWMNEFFFFLCFFVCKFHVFIDRRCNHLIITLGTQ